MRKTHIFFLVAGISLLMSCVQKEITDAFGNRWDLKTLRQNKQLPEGEWSEIASDWFGFLWVGGKSGLIRFDPRTPEKGWTNFVKDTHYPGGKVKSMEISLGGTLWVYPATGGVYEVDIDHEGKQIVVENPQVEPSEMQWKPLAPMPYGNHDVYGALLNGKIYIPGGGAYHGLPAIKTNFDRMMIYDIQNDSWRLSSPMSTNRRYCNVGRLEDKIWVVGGFVEKDGIEHPTNTVEIYNPQEDAWTTAPSLSHPCAEIVAGVINERLYVAYSSRDRKESYMQSIASGETGWRNETPPPYPIYQTDGCVYKNSFFIMIPSIGLISYDTNSQTWKTDHKEYPDKQIPRAAALATFKDRIWVISGTDMIDEHNVVSYHSREDRWEKEAPLPYPTLWADAIEADGGLYLFGGATFSKIHQTYVFWNLIRVYK